jgi:hypothetical protein
MLTFAALFWVGVVLSVFIMLGAVLVLVGTAVLAMRTGDAVNSWRHWNKAGKRGSSGWC